MVKKVIGVVFRFLARSMVMAAIFKSGLDIVLHNRATPKLIVSRSHVILSRLQEYIYMD